MFAGFGAQHRKMAKELYLSNPLFASCLDAVDELIDFEAGYSIVEMVLDDSQTYEVENSQVGIFAIQVALINTFRDLGVTPGAVIGHSMGGGGTLEASRTRPSLQAAIPLTPWNTTKSFSGNKVPTLVVGAERDTIASVAAPRTEVPARWPTASRRLVLPCPLRPTNAVTPGPISTSTPG